MSIFIKMIRHRQFLVKRLLIYLKSDFIEGRAENHWSHYALNGSMKVIYSAFLCYSSVSPLLYCHTSNVYWSTALSCHTWVIIHLHPLLAEYQSLINDPDKSFRQGEQTIRRIKNAWYNSDFRKRLMHLKHLFEHLCSNFY